MQAPVDEKEDLFNITEIKGAPIQKEAILFLVQCSKNRNA